MSAELNTPPRVESDDQQSTSVVTAGGDSLPNMIDFKSLERHRREPREVRRARRFHRFTAKGVLWRCLNPVSLQVAWMRLHLSTYDGKSSVLFADLKYLADTKTGWARQYAGAGCPAFYIAPFRERACCIVSDVARLARTMEPASDDQWWLLIHPVLNTVEQLCVDMRHAIECYEHLLGEPL